MFISILLYQISKTIGYIEFLVFLCMPPLQADNEEEFISHLRMKHLKNIQQHRNKKIFLPMERLLIQFELFHLTCQAWFIN